MSSDEFAGFYFELEKTFVLGKTVEEALKNFSVQLWYGMVPLYMIAQKGDTINGQDRINVRVFTLDGYNILQKDEKKKVHLHSKSTGDRII